MRERKNRGNVVLARWGEKSVIAWAVAAAWAGAVAVSAAPPDLIEANPAPPPPEEVEPGNPVLCGADPDVLVVGDTLWVYPTFGRQAFHAFSTKDLVNWRRHGPVLRFADVPWIAEEREGQPSYAWAPGVIEKDGRFFLYYSIGPKPSHVGVAVATSPSGPFLDSGRPLLADNGAPDFEAIDAMVFTDPPSGKSYFYAGGSAGASLRVYELNEDMISFARRVPVETPLHFTEAPFMHTRDGIYYLSYSRGYWGNQTYSVHYSTAPSPTGPWTYRGQILGSDSKHKGPGHHSVFRKPGTDDWFIVYHRWNDREGPGPYADGSRAIAIDRLEYFPDGRIKPVVMTDSGVGPLELAVDCDQRED